MQPFSHLELYERSPIIGYITHCTGVYLVISLCYCDSFRDPIFVWNEGVFACCCALRGSGVIYNNLFLKQSE